MASLKKALSKVVSHTRSLSKSSSRDLTNGNGHPLMNGHADQSAEPKVQVDDTNAKGETAAMKQQSRDAVKEPDRPSSTSSRRLSFTEQKDERKAEREAKDEEEARLRKERMKKAHDEVRVSA